MPTVLVVRETLHVFIEKLSLEARTRARWFNADTLLRSFACAWRSDERI